ncbi:MULTISPECIES: glucose-1-phosphate cytidylyltransferase [Bradyrhizobium]|jgi:glucose-1-phosphate cytidylyltransferase|uniref:Glucose-1-phosphate cytidylyltransferase n=2 Tax=Bradyrhizobium TaxID=374 RepID=A0ABY0Q6Z5_9BRAD|nr:MULTISPECIES: glucose-1-phosphate cytidylyltransferase [Bradyrhizobium]SDJ62567.1 glucose-1-phosphate cytidylyltransferase [Bradyrhizobium ottawaense]SEC34596.1 glucose-1-phosphate cytidylyltransferase [Bradyrhizobium lablabi]SHK61033.1 glucose-1-phosphate cytidylyltransferase [Bradyrhizobium lablabi]
MKAVLLAGGLGTRFSEETDTRPKPMIEIGGKPILWHIMKIYASHGINDFIVCLGYKGYVIKEYFSNYFLHQSNVTFDMRENKMHVLRKDAEPWTVTLIDTGESTMIGGRIKQILPYLGDDQDFCLTYGDGVGDINITESIAFHRREGRLATVTATQPPGRFGAINFEGNRVTSFQEKPSGDGGFINGGFFVLSPKVGSYIEGNQTVWEQEPMINLAKDSQLSVFFHEGFWHPMDTLRDKRYLEDLWSSGKAPWKKW